MANADDADPRGKRDPRDFALWKGRKADEPESASWPTPFGAGRPGWHLECSAMARRWLGDEFDIHGGGIDLRFPHHENEQAQSRAAGLGFARYWLHNAWVTVKGQKMGKSLGNALEVRHLLEETRPIVLRYYLTAAHYRSTIEYHRGSLDEAAAAVERIEGFLERRRPPRHDRAGGRRRAAGRVRRLDGRRPRRQRGARGRARHGAGRQQRARRGRRRGGPRGRRRPSSP